MHEAVDVLWPVLAAGGAATAQGMAEEGGSRLFAIASAILAKLRHRIGDDVARPDLESAVRAALTAGDVSPGDLRELLATSQGTTFIKNVFSGDVNVGRDFHC